jgi:tripartite-type tricarboxylate transporter receptor subunit TctC
MLFTRLACRCGIVALLIAAFAIPALAQSAAQWPDRPVRLLVSVGAGGAADTLSRNVSNGFVQFANGQPLIVENRPGAGGVIAAAAVAREKPDGYTLFLAEMGPNAVSHMLTAKLSYDPHTAFTPIIQLVNLPAVVLIRPALPYKTLAEYIAAAKQTPGKFNYASAGLGNWTHLYMAYFNSLAGIDVVNVVYRSGSEMLTALLRNEADTAIITVSTSLGQINEGKVRALAGASMLPMPQLPDTPPVGKTVPGFDVAVWHGIAAPTGMDSVLVARINGVFNDVLRVPAVRTAIATRPCQAIDETGADWIGDGREHDRHGAGCLQQRGQGRIASSEDDVRRERGQFRRIFANAVGFARAPAIFHPHVAAVGPAQLRQRLQERGIAGDSFRIVLGKRRQHADTAHPLALLRARGERPRNHRAADRGYQFPASDCDRHVPLPCEGLVKGTIACRMRAVFTFREGGMRWFLPWP